MNKAVQATRQSRVSDLRRSAEKMANPVNSKWRIVAIILAIVVLRQGLELYRIQSSLKNIFHYDVEVTLKDKVTGEIIRGGATRGPGSSTSDLFNQSTRFGGGMDAREISGIAYEPREFRFGADGYESSKVVVTDDTPWSIVVELEPKQNEAERGATGQSTTRSGSDSEENQSNGQQAADPDHSSTPVSNSDKAGSNSNLKPNTK